MGWRFIMVDYGDRGPSSHIEDRDPREWEKTSPKRSGIGVIAGFLGALAIGVGGVMIGGVNQVLEFIGIERQIPIPELDDARALSLKDKAAILLGDTERVWGRAFAAQGKTYDPVTLVLYADQATGQCGVVTGRQGPVYCAFDRKIYLDLEFINTLEAEWQAKGDFPMAFIIAHETGHHVQNLNGEMDRYFNAFSDPNAEAVNQLQVRLELQADCYSGVWTHHAEAQFGILEDGDIEEAIAAAFAFGDDTLQMRTRGVINEAAFTHGSGEQRARWFQIGFKSGDLASCNTWDVQPFDKL
ncbi:MAG: neutral zinc metallopeptidase [Neomegalonema sp.]|nr:neutral zinc metallopeptidase [Neomegalonema sp.]